MFQTVDMTPEICWHQRLTTGIQMQAWNVSVKLKALMFERTSCRLAGGDANTDSGRRATSAAASIATLIGAGMLRPPVMTPCPP